jgi:hypothetical protein
VEGSAVVEDGRWSEIALLMMLVAVCSGMAWLLTIIKARSMRPRIAAPEREIVGI